MVTTSLIGVGLHGKRRRLKLRDHFTVAERRQFAALVLRAGVFGILRGQRREIFARLGALENVVNLLALGRICSADSGALRGRIHRQQQDVPHMHRFRLLKIRRMVRVILFRFGIRHGHTQFTGQSRRRGGLLGDFGAQHVRRHADRLQLTVKCLLRTGAFEQCGDLCLRPLFALGLVRVG